MAVCLNYQSVAARPLTGRRVVVISVRLQVAAAALLLVALGAKVWIKIACTDVGYQLARARQEAVELDMVKRELELDVALRLRPDLLAQQAAQSLGLRPLRSEQARRVVYQVRGAAL